MSLLLLFLKRGSSSPPAVVTDDSQTVRSGWRRQGSEWYQCMRCGLPYPRSMVIVQNGLIVCRGPRTVGCYDEPGHAADMNRLDLPREIPIDPLPSVVEDL